MTVIIGILLIIFGLDPASGKLKKTKKKKKKEEDNPDRVVYRQNIENMY
jgi:uncharacterized membrane protein